MALFNGIKAISFDAVGTLFHLRRPVGEVYAEAAQSVGLKVDADEATQSFRKILPALRRREDAHRPDDDRGFWKNIVAEVLKNCGFPDDADQVGKVFEIAYDRYRGAAEWKLFPETISVLKDLQSRFPLLVISNYDGRIHGTLEELGIRDFFTQVIVSSEVGSEKPSAGIFRIASTAIDLPPGTILHVGDEQRADYEGAQKAGLPAWLLDRPQTTLKDLLPLLM